jgi:hypothetical protein
MINLALAICQFALALAIFNKALPTIIIEHDRWRASKTWLLGMALCFFAHGRLLDFFEGVDGRGTYVAANVLLTLYAYFRLKHVTRNGVCKWWHVGSAPQC